MKPLPPDFRSPEFLRGHILHTMSFYDGRCLDPTGGFFHYFKDDGEIYDRATRHLVSSARFVITHALASRHFTEHPRAQAWRDAVRHGLDFVQHVHRDPATGAYAWVLRWENGQRTVVDPTNHCYGLAFVLLAHAHALMAGVQEARPGLEATYAEMERRFWQPEHGLYADEASAPGELSPYRGQNANMHACEAMLACHEATGDTRYVERAATLAYSITEVLARHTDGLIWEHYHADWTPDWEFHRHDDSDIFRPWGFQTGHQAEWAKLLLGLERARPNHPSNEPLVHRARALFAAAVNHGWDRQHDGLANAFWRDETPGHEGRYVICDGHKIFWVQAETIAASALLAERTLEGGYWDWYDRVWDFAWAHFVDHEHGAWFRILAPDNTRLGDQKSPAGKTDYHTMGACFEVLASMERTPTPV
jgi:mannose/cellobiose epimerase-like protein (N-acyl-D-glucosamine 2-epimerase family)